MRVRAGADWGETLDTMCVQAAGDEIRQSGRCLAPRLHLLVDGPELPYVGYLACRPFYRGDDAITAVGMMGAMAALLGASRVVLTWEHQDMCAALRLPDAPAGQVVLDAYREGGRHVLRWHPVWIEPDPQHRDSESGSTPAWGPTDTVPDADLPPFAGACLAAWRQPGEWTDAQLLARMVWFEQNGYAPRASRAPTASRAGRGGWTCCGRSCELPRLLLAGACGVFVRPTLTRSCRSGWIDVTAR